VPYQLRSSALAEDRDQREVRRTQAGDLRRGRVNDPEQRQVPRTRQD